MVAQPPPPLPAWDESQVDDADEQVVIAHNWDELRLLMWNYVGIVRTTKRLQRALHRIELLRAEIDWTTTPTSASTATCWNCATWSRVRRAHRAQRRCSRHESRGLHFSRDYPYPLPVSFPTVLSHDPRSS